MKHAHLHSIMLRLLACGCSLRLWRRMTCWLRSILWFEWGIFRRWALRILLLTAIFAAQVLCSLCQKLLFRALRIWSFSLRLVLLTKPLATIHHLVTFLCGVELRVLQFGWQLSCWCSMMHCDTVWCCQVDKIITVSIFFTQLLTVGWFLVSPNEFRNFLNIWRCVEIYNWALLWVHVGVSKNEFFVLKLRHTGIRQLIPSLGFRADTFSIKSVLILLELGQKTGSHLQIRSPGIQKL